MKVRNLQFINGDIVYQDYTIKMVSGVDCGEVYVDWFTESDFDFSIVECSLDDILNTIDYRIKNGLTGKG